MSLPPRWGDYERGKTAEKKKAARMCVEKEDTVVMTMASLLFFVSLLLPAMWPSALGSYPATAPIGVASTCKAKA